MQDKSDFDVARDAFGALELLQNHYPTASNDYVSRAQDIMKMVKAQAARRKSIFLFGIADAIEWRHKKGEHPSAG